MVRSMEETFASIFAVVTPEYIFVGRITKCGSFSFTIKYDSQVASKLSWYRLQGLERFGTLASFVGALGFTLGTGLTFS